MSELPVAPIRVLPPTVAARIAAGEVITRPLSVVRELVDNALDAGARHIDIELSQGGYDLIAVHDDGGGICSADCQLLGIRHATSKLPLDAVLEISTLGFRGEALASIFAVADVEIRTRVSDEALGTRVTREAEMPIQRAPIARRTGTSVEVKRLFRRMPVRRNSADPASEQRLILRWVTTCALVNPAVGFTLRNDDRVLFSSRPAAFQEALENAWGASVAQRLLPFGPLLCGDVQFDGVISGPSTHRSRRDQVVVSVNGRMCSVPELSQALERVWREHLPRGRYPYLVLRICAPPAAIDVNIHPSKDVVAMSAVSGLAALVERELHAVLGRALYQPADTVRLVLRDSSLDGHSASEATAGYETGTGWGQRIVEAGSLPRLRIVGQVDDTLIVCETANGALLIDQHRAHERVIFERLRDRSQQRFAPPIPLHLSGHALRLVEERNDELNDAGWIIELCPPHSAILHACPVGFEPGDLIGILEHAGTESNAPFLAAVACHNAIRKRQPLTVDAAEALLAALTLTTNPTTCPHGQPIILQLDHRFLERQFVWR
ncbi:MAG: DNA mismatch repair endonuclease MutL [Chloroflexi bacterium]|nr:MAG: DNA mismatch repair endonuclease MutL [Chloroflexota bacterium]